MSAKVSSRAPVNDYVVCDDEACFTLCLVAVCLKLQVVFSRRALNMNPSRATGNPLLRSGKKIADHSVLRVGGDLTSWSRNLTAVPSSDSSSQGVKRTRSGSDSGISKDARPGVSNIKPEPNKKL